jgi:hypothetical protein
METWEASAIEMKTESLTINRGSLVQLCDGCYESIKGGAYGLKQIEHVGEIPKVKVLVTKTRAMGKSTTL